ncbi:MAG: GatB/YqeY domain-containing protein [Terriglobia bacterium]
MTLLEKVNADLTTSMKEQQPLRLSVLRMMKSALQLKQSETGKALADEDAQAVLRTFMKQRRDAAEIFRQAGRDDLAEKELTEMGIVEGYLPAAATASEMEAAVAAAIEETGAAGAKGMGKVMKAAMSRLAGRTVDGKRLSELVRSKLGA